MEWPCSLMEVIFHMIDKKEKFKHEINRFLREDIITTKNRGYRWCVSTNYVSGLFQVITFYLMYIKYGKDHNFYSYFMVFLSEPMTKKDLFSMNIGSVHFKSFPLWNFSSYTLSIFLYVAIVLSGLAKGGGGDFFPPLGKSIQSFHFFNQNQVANSDPVGCVDVLKKFGFGFGLNIKIEKNPFKINPFFEYSLTKAIIRKVFIFQL